MYPCYSLKDGTTVYSGMGINLDREIGANCIHIKEVSSVRAVEPLPCFGRPCSKSAHEN